MSIKMPPEKSTNLVIDGNRCMGCRICELACSFHFHQVFNPEQSNIRIFFTDKGFLDIRVLPGCSCRSQAPCVEACPVKAIQVNRESTG